MAFVINVIKWLLWTVETMYQAEFFGAKHFSTLSANTTMTQSNAGPMLAHYLRR